MNNTQKAIAAAAGVSVFSILAYLGYKVIKQIGEIDIDWENLDDVYYYNTPADHQGSSSDDGSTES